MSAADADTFLVCLISSCMFETTVFRWTPEKVLLKVIFMQIFQNSVYYLCQVLNDEYAANEITIGMEETEDFMAEFFNEVIMCTALQ